MRMKNQKYHKFGKKMANKKETNEKETILMKQFGDKLSKLSYF